MGWAQHCLLINFALLVVVNTYYTSERVGSAICAIRGLCRGGSRILPREKGTSTQKSLAIATSLEVSS